MKAVVIYEPGGPEKLVYAEVPKPAVKDGWSLIKIQGFGVNHSEVFTRQGLSPSVKCPRILGIECVGTVEESEVFPKGQQVISIMGEMGRAFDGSYAEYTLLPNGQLYPVDTDLPLATLCALPETYYTAYGSLLNLKITDSDSVLVRGATSGVGIAFLKLVKAKYPQIKITGTSRQASKAARLLAAGFDAVVTDQDNVLQSDKKFDKVLDLIGPAALRDTFAHTNGGGIICVTGLLGGQWALTEFDPLEELPADAYLTAFHSGNVSKEKLQAMLRYVAQYGVNATPEKVFRLEEVPQAHEYLAAADSFGKVVVLNDH